MDCQPVDWGRPALRYLARCVRKTALGAKRILGYTPDGRIRLSCLNSNTERWGGVALSSDTFIERFLNEAVLAKCANPSAVGPI